MYSVNHGKWETSSVCAIVYYDWRFAMVTNLTGSKSLKREAYPAGIWIKPVSGNSCEGCSRFTPVQLLAELTMGDVLSWMNGRKTEATCITLSSAMADWLPPWPPYCRWLQTAAERKLSFLKLLLSGCYVIEMRLVASGVTAGSSSPSLWSRSYSFISLIREIPLLASLFSDWISPPIIPLAVSLGYNIQKWSKWGVNGSVQAAVTKFNGTGSS